MTMKPGGFGSGSAFAMEDSWTLARAIEYARSVAGSDASPSVVAEALRIFNEIRKPYYKAMCVVFFLPSPRSGY
jgi:salicylate hydroxylase